METGWITLHRKLTSSSLNADSQAFHLWVNLLLLANHKNSEELVKYNNVKVKKGQLLTSRNKLSMITGIQESKIERLLKLFVKMKIIEQQSFSKFRLISIVKWQHYQNNEQQVNNKRTASEQQVNTYNNDNNDNNDNKSQKHSRFAPPSVTELNEYANKKSLIMDTAAFIDFYQSKNWMVGKNKMKDWEASARNWARRNKRNGSGNYEKKSNSRKLSAVERVEIATREKAEREGYN